MLVGAPVTTPMKAGDTLMVSPPGAPRAPAPGNGWAAIEGRAQTDPDPRIDNMSGKTGS